MSTTRSPGAQASNAQLKKILSYLDIGRAEGAEVLTGGDQPALEGDLAGGYYVKPTIFKGTNNMRVFQEEIFGPVLSVTTFKTFEEAMEKANATEYGLASYVATRDLATAIRAAEELEAGIVSIGDFSPATVLSPFGGMKQSGIGREGGREGILEYLEAKAISLAL